MAETLMKQAETHLEVELEARRKAAPEYVAGEKALLKKRVKSSWNSKFDTKREPVTVIAKTAPNNYRVRTMLGK